MTWMGEALAKAIEAEWPLQWNDDRDGTRRTFDEIADALLAHDAMRTQVESHERRVAEYVAIAISGLENGGGVTYADALRIGAKVAVLAREAA